MASTMLQRIISTKTFFNPAFISDPARQRMIPQSLSWIMRSKISAARARSRALYDIPRMASTRGTTL